MLSVLGSFRGVRIPIDKARAVFGRDELGEAMERVEPGLETGPLARDELGGVRVVSRATCAAHTDLELLPTRSVAIEIARELGCGAFGVRASASRELCGQRFR